MQRIPAGLPPGIPGMGLVMEMAIQQAPQPGLQFICQYIIKNTYTGNTLQTAAGATNSKCLHLELDFISIWQQQLRLHPALG